MRPVKLRESCCPSIEKASIPCVSVIPGEPAGTCLSIEKVRETCLSVEKAVVTCPSMEKAAVTCMSVVEA